MAEWIPAAEAASEVPCRPDEADMIHSAPPAMLEVLRRLSALEARVRELEDRDGV